MSYRPSVIAALLALLATPASAGNVIDPYTLFPPAAPTGIAYKGRGTVTNIPFNTTTTTATVDLPDSPAVNDLLVGITVSRPSAGPTTGATGWTRNNVQANTWSDYAAATFSHLVTTPGSEPGSIDFSSISASQYFIGVVLAFSGGTSVDAVECSSSEGSAASSIDTPNVTPTAATGIIVSFVVSNKVATRSFTTVPATEVVKENSPTGNDALMAVSYAASSGTSSQGSKNFVVSAATGYIACSVAIH